MSTIKVAAALQTLFCFHGADEEESEPYLWTIMFTVDGRTITHTPDAPKLTGKPAFSFGPGQPREPRRIHQIRCHTAHPARCRALQHHAATDRA